MQIDLLRHGECEGGQIFRGHTDVALTEHGWQQMNAGLEQLTANWQSIVSSPLQRCRLFAEQLSSKTQLPLTIEPAFKEINYGEWEGQLIESVWRDREEQVLAWSRDPEKNGPPDGEAFHHFRERVLNAVLSLAKHDQKEKTLLITHGGVIKLLLSIANQQPPAWMMQLKAGYGFSASLSLKQGQLSVLYPQESDYVYSS